MKLVAVQRRRTRPRSARPAGSDYRVMHKLADRARPGLAKKVRAAIEQFRSTVNTDEIRGALVSGDVEHMLMWQRFETALEPLHEELGGLMRRAAEAESKQMQEHARLVRKAEKPKTVIVSLVFNAHSPEVERWAREHSGELIEGIADESLAAVRAAIADTIASGRDYGSSAQRIKDAVGLTEQGAGAVGRLRELLESQGGSPEFTDKKVEALRNRLLTQRAETISRTETIKATNQGQLLYWQQLVGSGAVAREDAKKVWVVTPDDRLCPICEPLGGETVGLDDKFMTSLGSVDAPPVHPNCRCAVSLEIG